MLTIKFTAKLCWPVLLQFVSCCFFTHIPTCPFLGPNVVQEDNRDLFLMNEFLMHEIMAP